MSFRTDEVAEQELSPTHYRMAKKTQQNKTKKVSLRIKSFFANEKLTSLPIYRYIIRYTDNFPVISWSLFPVDKSHTKAEIFKIDSLHFLHMTHDNNSNND